MLATFPVQGYGEYSIAFSTLFLIASYWFTYFFITNTAIGDRQKFSYRCVRTSLYYLVLSSIGPWALGAIMITLGNESIWYRIAIYYYLHFLYNGWAILAVCGMLLYILEQYQLSPSVKELQRFYWLMNASIILTFFLSVLWTNPASMYYGLGILGIILQLIAFGIFYQFFGRHWSQLTFHITPLTARLLQLAATVFVIKLALQTLSSLPFFAHLAYSVVDFVIGYLHLVFIGVLSISMFALLGHFKLLSFPKYAVGFYLLGFAGSELLIFYKGIVVWQELVLFGDYFLVLVLASGLIALALLLLVLSNLIRKV